MLTLNYRDSRPIYEQIKDGLRRMIVTGAMAQDEKAAVGPGAGHPAVHQSQHHPAGL